MHSDTSRENGEEPPSSIDFEAFKKFHSAGRGYWGDVSGSDWNDWHWQLKHRITSAEQLQRLLSDDEVTRAMVSPPPDTRAFFRGECLRRYPSQVAAASWDSVVFDLGRENLVRIPTMEPLRGTRDHVGALFEASATAQELVDTITGS